MIITNIQQAAGGGAATQAWKFFSGGSVVNAQFLAEGEALMAAEKEKYVPIFWFRLMLASICAAAILAFSIFGYFGMAQVGYLRDDIKEVRNSLSNDIGDVRKEIRDFKDKLIPIAARMEQHLDEIKQQRR